MNCSNRLASHICLATDLSVSLLADCCLRKLPLDCCFVSLARLDCLGSVLKCHYQLTHDPDLAVPGAPLLGAPGAVVEAGHRELPP